MLTHGTNWTTIASSHTPKRTTLALKNHYSALRLRHRNKNGTRGSSEDGQSSHELPSLASGRKGWGKTSRGTGEYEDNRIERHEIEGGDDEDGEDKDIDDDDDEDDDDEEDETFNAYPLAESSRMLQPPPNDAAHMASNPGTSTMATTDTWSGSGVPSFPFLTNSLQNETSALSAGYIDRDVPDYPTYLDTSKPNPDPFFSGEHTFSSVQDTGRMNVGMQSAPRGKCGPSL